jgi:hypothetical protein
MCDTICFEFNAHNIPDKNTLIPQKDDIAYFELAENISFSRLECGCCWTVYLLIQYEYTYREWLDIQCLIPTETRYISNIHNVTKNWLYLDDEQKKFTGFLNELIASKNEETELLTRDWTVKYNIANKPVELFVFTKDIHRVSDIYAKLLELFISAIETYKDFLPQYANWGISNNLVYAKKLQMPKQMALKYELNELRMFDIHINGKKEVECIVY